MSQQHEDSQTPPIRPQWFTTTHWSVVLAARQNSSPAGGAALEQLCRTYWYPLYAYIRRQGYSPDDAQDLTQGFFARLLERNYLASVGPEKGKFRSFLLASLNHFLCDEHDRANAAKRGGGELPISLEMAENLLAAEPTSGLPPDKEFEKRWATVLLQETFGRLKAEFEQSGRGATFERLKPFLEQGVGRGAYLEVADELKMSANAVAAAVRRLRQRYRELVRAEIANTVATPEEVEEELRYLFAVLAQ